MSKQFGYYGRYDDIIPAKKVHEYMLDEYIKHTLQIEIENFKNELAELSKHLKKEVKEEVVALKLKFKKLEELVAKMPQPVLKKQLPEKEYMEKERIKKNLKAKGFKVD